MKKPLKESFPFNLNGKLGETVKTWLKKASDFTREESKVLGVRAQEAGALTRLSAQRYKLKRDYEAVCAEIGQQVLELLETGKDSAILSSPKVRELIGKAEQLEREVKLAEEDMERTKKETDSRVRDIHKKAA